MMVKDIMTPNPETIPFSASAFDAAEEMKKLDVGGLPVEQDNRISGFITDRDLVTRVLAENRNPGDTHVGDIMSEGLYNCKTTDSLATAMNIMEKQKVRRLIVTNNENKMVGIIALGDLATRWNEEASGEVVSEVSEPSKPER